MFIVFHITSLESAINNKFLFVWKSLLFDFINSHDVSSLEAEIYPEPESEVETPTKGNEDCETPKQLKATEEHIALCLEYDR